MTNEQLKERDYILLVDKSGSMGTRDQAGGKSRWQAAEEMTLSLARKCAEFDQDGITVIPFSGNHREYENVTGGEEKVAQIFKENEPSGSTNTAKVLDYVLKKYLANPKKPITVLVLTDGEPDSKTDVENVIIAATKQMNADEQIGISFIQVGNDPGATSWLKVLDDGLVAKGAKFDIVDTKTFDEIENSSLTDVLIAALND